MLKLPFLQNLISTELDLQKTCNIDYSYKKKCCKSYKNGKRCKSCPKKKKD